MKPGLTICNLHKSLYNQWKTPHLLTFKYAAASWTVRFLWTELPHSCSPGKMKTFILIYLLLHYIKKKKHLNTSLWLTKFTQAAIEAQSFSDIPLNTWENLCMNFSFKRSLKTPMIFRANNMYKSHQYNLMYCSEGVFQYLHQKQNNR